MPAGRWSGLGASYVTLERVEELVFPGDKKTRDRVHARLAKKIAAREAEKTERMSGGGDAALAAQMKQELAEQPVGCVVQYVLRRASRPECL